MKVALFGFGNIGKMKARLYQEEGLSVHIVEPRITSSNRKEERDYTFYPSSTELFATGEKFDIFEICTPTDLHCTVAGEILTRIDSGKIVIEKPLSDRISEAQILRDDVLEQPDVELFVSENYILSSVISKVSRVLKENSLKVQEVRCEFSKDRRRDIESGRFIDMNLRSLGIEIPHMISVMEELGIHFIFPLHVDQRNVFANGEKLSGHGGCIVKYLAEGDVKVSLCQMLDGSIYLKETPFGSSLKRTEKFRVMNICCDNDYEIWIQFEPVSDCERYISRVLVYKKGKLADMTDLRDNTLLETIRYIIGYNPADENKNILSIDKGVRMMEILHSLNAYSREKYDEIFENELLYPNLFC